MNLDINHFHKPETKSITIGDVRNWKVDQIYDLCLLDYNFQEYKIWNLEPNKTYKPTDFFSANRNTYKHEGPFKGHIYWNFGKDREFTDFYIEIVRGTYQKINHRADAENDTHICFVCAGTPNVSPDDYPDDTKIGWRGPMVLWDDIVELENKGYMFYYT